MSSRFTLFVLVASSASIWALILAANGRMPEGFFQPLSYVVGVLSVMMLVFERFAWRWPPFTWLIKRPDLHGTWGGTLVSDYEGALNPYEAFMVVHQTFSTLRMSLLTRESQSLTTTASMIVEPDDRISVFNVYRNDPELRHQRRSRSHRGALQLTVVGSDGKTLEGEYWTDRKSTGSLGLRLISRARAAGWQEAVELAKAAKADGGMEGAQKGGGQQELALDSVAVGEHVPHGFIDLLAQLANDSEQARTIATRAGFPPEHLPEFKTALGFWSSVVQQAAHGRIGLPALVGEIVKQFPHNDALRVYAETIEGSAPSPSGATIQQSPVDRSGTSDPSPSSVVS